MDILCVHLICWSWYAHLVPNLSYWGHWNLGMVNMPLTNCYGQTLWACTLIVILETLKWKMEVSVGGGFVIFIGIQIM